MVDREGGQWNVAIKDEAVYVERVSKDEERQFEDLLEPHEARGLARLLKKYADQLDDSQSSDNKKKSRDSDDSDDSKSKDKDEDSDDDSGDDDSDDEDSDDDGEDKKDKKSDSDD